MLIQCCVCKKIQRERTWEAAPAHYHDASHTYCPPCAEDAFAELESVKRAFTSPMKRIRPASLQELFQSQQPLAQLGSDSTF